MTIITKISVQKNRSDRYNIYLDEKFAFGVDEEIFIKHGLRKGKELTELDITQIQYADEISKAYNAAIQYLSFRMRSKKEIADHLKKKEWEGPVIDAVLEKLRNRGYTDDLEFARAYVRTVMNGGKKGPQTIRQELKEKGVAEKDIGEALDPYSKEEQVERAVRLGEKAVRQYSRLSEKMLKQKLQQLLLQKGFSFDVISIALEEIAYEKDDGEEWESLVAEAQKAKRRFRSYSGSVYRQKMKQALYRKGFSIDAIDRFLEEDEPEQ